MKSRIFSRLVLLVAVAVAAAAIISSAGPLQLPADRAAGRARAAAAEPGLLPGRLRAGVAARLSARQRSSPRRPARRASRRTWSATTAAGRSPSRYRSRSRLHAHGAIPYVQIDPTARLGLRRSPAGIYDVYLRTYADSVRDFGHAVVIGFGHEMNASLVLVGLRARPGRDVRGGVAAHRDAVPRPGRRQRHLAVDASTRMGPAPGPSPPGGRARATSPGSASTATTTVPPTPSPASSARPSPRCGSSPTSRSCCPRPRSGPLAGQFAKIQNLFDGMRQYKTLGLVWFDIAQSDGILHQDWRIENSQPARAAFRLGVSTLTLARPSSQ